MMLLTKRSRYLMETITLTLFSLQLELSQHFTHQHYIPVSMLSKALGF